MNYLPIIGSFDWSGCDKCVYCHPVKGGCSVPDAEWRAKLEPDYDAILCGAFKRREDERKDASTDYCFECSGTGLIYHGPHDECHTECKECGGKGFIERKDA